MQDQSIEFRVTTTTQEQPLPESLVETASISSSSSPLGRKNTLKKMGKRLFGSINKKMGVQVLEELSRGGLPPVAESNTASTRVQSPSKPSLYIHSEFCTLRNRDHTSFGRLYYKIIRLPPAGDRIEVFIEVINDPANSAPDDR